MRFLLAFVLSVTSCSHKEDTGDKGAGVSPSFPRAPTSPANPGIPGGIVEQQQYMVFHNLKRCWHRTADVRWSETLAAGALAHAKACSLKKDPAISGRLGENIAHGVGLGQIKAQDNWYMPFIYFPYGDKNGTPATAEFSQIVWRETAEIGCASATCGAETFYVCRYSPAGNVAGKYDTNVYSLDPGFLKCTGMPRS